MELIVQTHLFFKAPPKSSPKGRTLKRGFLLPLLGRGVRGEVKIELIIIHKLQISFLTFVLIMKYIFLLSLIVLTGFTTPSNRVLHNEWKTLFDKRNVSGCIAVYDLNKGRCDLYNEDIYTKGFTPASTFKIFNSLVGLETGVIPDENFVLKWDGKIHDRAEWNKDTDLKNAYKNSTVWYYQELARRVGYKKMRYWINKTDYGNNNIKGGIDHFWLSGKLRISPEQQINFLQRIYKEELPFSKRSISILKKIMIEKDTAGYVLRAKTGMSEDNDGHTIGWYVGYVETKDNVYFFSTFLQAETEIPDFAKSRKEITKEVLHSLNILP